MQNKRSQLALLGHTSMAILIARYYLIVIILLVKKNKTSQHNRSYTVVMLIEHRLKKEFQF